MLVEPTLHHVNVSQGALQNPTGNYQKRLSELAGLYQDEEAFQKAALEAGESVVYEVTDCRPEVTRGNMIFGVTRMQPGKIGNEFYLTRGHIHAVANRPEIYYCEAGRGVMLMESPEGEIRTIELTPRAMCYVPPFWIHRSVNVGADTLVMSFFYPADSGQDYEVIRDTGGMKSRIVAVNGGWEEIPNPNYQPRSQVQIDAIYASGDQA